MVSHESVEAGWKFDTEEVSAGVYRVFGNDRWGRNIECTGADPDLLLAQCKREALQIASPGTESLDSGSAAVTEERVVFSGNTVEVGGGQLRLDFPVRDAFRSADRLIVLFDPDMRPRGSKKPSLPGPLRKTPLGGGISGTGEAGLLLRNRVPPAACRLLPLLLRRRIGS